MKPRAEIKVVSSTNEAAFFYDIKKLVNIQILKFYSTKKVWAFNLHFDIDVNII